jgi:hypothetical protein
MKDLLILSLLLSSPALLAQTQPCEDEVYASDLVVEHQRNQQELPEEILNISEDLRDIKLCKVNNELQVLSHKELPPQHLVNAGLYLGLPWMAGLQATYTNLTEGKYNYHIGIASGGSLGASGLGVKYGKHINGSSFYYGGMLYQYKTTNSHGTMLGPTVGISGGKSIINLHTEVGLMGTYEQASGVSVLPHFTAGVRIRLFKK